MMSHPWLGFGAKGIWEDLALSKEHFNFTVNLGFFLKNGVF